MNTVQRVPRSQGCLAMQAMRANSSTGCCNMRAKVSMNEPQPDEQASLISMRLMEPFSMKIAFMSCPPMSSTNDTSGFRWRAAMKWAMVSTMPCWRLNAVLSRFSP